MLLLPALILLVTFLTPSFLSSYSQDTPEFRLSKAIVPDSYDILLKPKYIGNRILGIEDFEGTVQIIATVVTATDAIELYCGKNITIDEDSVQIFKVKEGSEMRYINNENVEDYKRFGISNLLRLNTKRGGNNKELCCTKIEPETFQVDDMIQQFYRNIGKIPILLDIVTINHDNGGTEKLTITLNNELKVGTVIKIVINYIGEINNVQLKGFYYSSYKNERNELSAILATQFQPLYARNAFPCFDEPWMKATFDLSIEVTPSVAAISNTPKLIEKTTLLETGLKRTIVKFRTTPIMSSYLLAFIIYEKDSFGKLGSNEKFATYGRMEFKGLQNFSHDEGPQILRTLENFTGIPYFASKSKEQELTLGMKKMDQVAVPEHFAEGMENWGLATYTENLLYYNDSAHSTAEHDLRRKIITHELAHQWFGNLVTCEWWNSFWLNEGFATFMEYYVRNKINKNWKMLERIVLEEQFVAFDYDSTKNSYTLTSNIDSESNIYDSNYAKIYYSKGATILRQINNVLGEEAFQEAVRDYLRERAFKSANPDDLFNSFVSHNGERTKRTNEQLKKAFKNWTEEPGFPVITVKRAHGNKIIVEQDRFLFYSNHAEKKTYHVYLTWFTDKSEDIPRTVKPPQAWITEDKVTIQLDESENCWNWIIVNPHQAGYYRVDYSKDLWDILTTVLQDPEVRKKISALDRAALINNALNLARSSVERNIDYAGAFELMTFLRSDFEFEPWAAARSSLAHVERLLINSQEYKDFLKFIVANAYNEVKFEDTTPEEKKNNEVAIMNRVNILTLACAAEYPPCLEEARERLEAFLLGHNNMTTDVHPDLQSVVYCCGLKGNDADDLWEKLWEKFLEVGKDTTRRILIASSLQCVNNKDKLKKYISYAFNEDLFPRNRANDVFEVCAKSEFCADAFLEVSEETDELFETLAKRFGDPYRVFYTIGNHVTTTTLKKKFQEMLEPHEDKNKTMYSSLLQLLNSNFKWLDSKGKSLKLAMKEVYGAQNPLSFYYPDLPH